MDHKDTETAAPPRRGPDPLTQYAIGCPAVILMWLAVGWLVVHLAPWP